MMYIKNRWISLLIFIFTVAMSPEKTFCQIDSSDYEIFPEDLFLETDGMDDLLKPDFLIPNNRLHIIFGYCGEYSATPNKFKKTFGSSALIQNTPYLGVEYQISTNLLAYIHFILPKSLKSTKSGNYYSVSNELKYGTSMQIGTMFNVKRISRMNLSAGGGFELHRINFTNKLTSDKYLVPNSLIFVNNAKQEKSLFGILGAFAADFYVTKHISVQAKGQFHFRPVETKIKDQNVIRRANVYFGTYDYIMGTYPGFKAGGGTAFIYEIGVRWHLF